MRGKNQLSCCKDVVVVRILFAAPVLPTVRLPSRLQPKVQCPLPVRLRRRAGAAHSLHTLPQPVGQHSLECHEGHIIGNAFLAIATFHSMV